MPPSVEVVLLFDYGGVISSAAVPAARRLGEHHMQLVFQAAAAAAQSTQGHSTPLASPLAPQSASSVLFPGEADTPTSTLAQKYSTIYFLVSQFTQRIVGVPSAWTNLEIGVIRRNGFITSFHKELAVCFKALASRTDEELVALNLRRAAEVADWKKRHHHLCHPLVQSEALKVLDAESLLCVLEKLSPRKNVLNLLHFLRAKTHQDIKLGIVTNNWESEGHYIRTSTAVRDTGSPRFLDMVCPVEYGSHTGAFDVNGVFDVVAQSYLLGKAKPSPDIYEIAVESVVGKDRAPQLLGRGSVAAHLTLAATGGAVADGAAPKPMVFYFDDIKANCDGAAKIASKPFTQVYHIVNGARDVYRCVVDALTQAAKRDVFWQQIVDAVVAEIEVLFPTKVRNSLPGGAKGASWVQAEFHNLDGNLLFFNPPPNTTLDPLDEVRGPNYMDIAERNRILFHLAKTCPQYFPLYIPPNAKSPADAGNLCTDGSFATSSGPILFEVFRGGMSNPTYRFTCRTGSFVIRKQPRGAVLPGAHNVQRECAIIQHLAAHSSVPVPKVVAFCSDKAVCEQDFYVMRYRDGRMVYKLQELAMAPFSRPFSQSRVLAKTTLNPRFFYKAAVNTLVALHQAPIPAFMQKKKAPSDPTALRMHPILHTVNIWDKQYQRALGKVPREAVSQVRFASFEFLTDALKMTFSHAPEGLTIPAPEKLCLVHGDYKIDNIMFSHRSMEGRSKYPPKILLLLDFELASVGDPLTDVAYLCLFHHFPSPKGIQDLDPSLQERYPTPDEVLEYYCQQANYLSTSHTATQRSKVFHVYMAAMCHKLAGIAHGVVVRGMLGNATDTQAALRLIQAVDHLSKAGCNLLGLEPPGHSKL